MGLKMNTKHIFAIERLFEFAESNPAFNPIHTYGGFVRDLYMGNTPKDLDIGVTGDITAFADAFEAFLGDLCSGRYSNARNENVVTVVIRTPNDEHCEVDVTLNRGYPNPATNTLDFTINSMAIEISDPELNIADLSTPNAQNYVIAPNGGITDIDAGILRQTDEDSIPRDPIRILRGIRTALTYDLEIDVDTKLKMRKHAPLLRDEPGERVVVELMRTVQLDPNWVWLYDQIGVFQALFPEIVRCDGVEQPPEFHRYDVLMHLQIAMGTMRSFFTNQSPVPLTDELLDYFNEEVGDGYTRRDLAILGAFLHDIGKPLTKGINDAGRICFHGHEIAGADIVKDICKRLKFSVACRSFLTRIVRYHMRPFAFLPSENGMKRRSVMRFRRDAGDADIAIMFFNIADVIAARGAMEIDDSELTEHVEILSKFLEMRDEQQMVIDAPRLLDGNDLIGLGIPQGPEIGKLLANLEDATVSGEITNRDEALNLVKEMGVV